MFIVILFTIILAQSSGNTIHFDFLPNFDNTIHYGFWTHFSDNTITFHFWPNFDPNTILWLLDSFLC